MKPSTRFRVRLTTLAVIGAAMTPASLTGQSMLGRIPEVRASIASGDAAKAIALADSIAAEFPHHPNVALTRARALIAGGRADESEQALRVLLKWDPRYLRFALNDSTLKQLAPRFADTDVSALATRADSAVSRGTVWATLEERDLIVEGTAWDPTTRSVLLGSLNKNTVVAIGTDGRVSDRVKRGDNGLGSVAGIHVDTARGTLWVASNRRYDTPADSAASALYAFDAATGRFKSKVMSPNRGPNFFNDITTGPDGTVYLTDTQGGDVFILRPGGAALEVFEAAGEIAAPNGITISTDGRHLFIADIDHIKVVDLRNNEIWKLDVPDSVNVTGIDGLAYADGSLIAHHPLSFWRVARYELDPSHRRITGRWMIERSSQDSHTSTTGEVVGGDYIYIGNSQIDRMNAGTIEFGTMEPVRIYRVRLPRR